MFFDVPGAKLFATMSGPMKGGNILAIGGWIGSSELWQEPLAMVSDAVRSTLLYLCGVLYFQNATKMFII